MPGADTTGFTVSTADGSMIVLVGGRQVYRAPVPAGNSCGLVLDADGAGTVLRLGGADPVVLPGDRVRSVSAFTTDLSGADATGLQVVARAADWFDVTSTGAKTALIVVQLLLAAASLALLALADRRRHGSRLRSREARTRLWRARAAAAVSPRAWARRTADVGVLVILGVWTVIGPLTTDDGFTEGIVANAAGSDAFTNYYRWENASEAPFTLVLRLVQPLVDAGANPLLLRVPSLVCGLLVWLLLSRVALPALLPRHARSVAVRLLLAGTLLIWWMPFDLGVRPEPFAAVSVTAVLAFVLRAAYRPGRAGLTWLGLTGFALGIALATTPSSVAAVGPVLVALPRLWRLARGGFGAGTPTHPAGLLRAAAVTAATAATAGVGLVVMFTGQSWYTVSRATGMHAFYGPNVAWYQEIQRYEYLLAFDSEQGGLGRRVPVLLTLALLVAVLPLLARGVQRLPGMNRVPVPALGLVAGLAMLSLTPSKWTHYFGSLAGIGAAALTAGVVLLVVAARPRSRPVRDCAGQPAVRLAAGAGAVAVVVAAALAYAGRNTWFIYSHYGVPHEDGPWRPLNTPLPWLALAAVVLVAGAVRLPFLRSGGGSAGVGRMLIRLPGVLAVVVTVTTVAVLLYSFAVAPGRQAGSYSVGGQMLAHLAGEDTCGLIDDVVTTIDTPGGALKPGPGTPELTGFTSGGGFRGTPPSPPGSGSSTFLWGSSANGAISTGTLSSQWFVLPKVPADQELAVNVSGRTAQGNRLALEFARERAGGGGPTPIGQRVLDDTATAPESQPEYPTDRVEEDSPLFRDEWRPLHLAPSAIPPGADLVRVRATDGATDPGGFLAVTGPRLRDVTPVRAQLESGGPVFVDWTLRWSAPCVRDNPRVTGGVAQAPETLLKAPADIGFSGEASFVNGIGGSFGPMSVIGTESVVP
ncbi:MAG: arabinosyltransferase, partial [Pseudonocardia sp.]|nr:arabinosyltransferase [Pseudonocardia sp.]